MGDESFETGAEPPGVLGEIRPLVAGHEKVGGAMSLADELHEKGTQALRAPFEKTEKRIAQDDREGFAPGGDELVQVTAEIVCQIKPAAETQAPARPTEEEIEKGSRRPAQGEIGRVVSPRRHRRAVGPPGHDESPSVGQKTFEGETASREWSRKRAELAMLLAKTAEKNGEEPGDPTGVSLHGRTPRWTATRPPWRS